MLMSFESEGERGVTVKVKGLSVRVRSRRAFHRCRPKEPLCSFNSLTVIYHFCSKVTVIMALQLGSCFSNSIGVIIPAVLLN